MHPFGSPSAFFEARLRDVARSSFASSDAPCLAVLCCHVPTLLHCHFSSMSQFAKTNIHKNRSVRHLQATRLSQQVASVQRVLQNLTMNYDGNACTYLVRKKGNRKSQLCHFGGFG